jgi:parallel beta-helix repeat protein
MRSGIFAAFAVAFVLVPSASLAAPPTAVECGDVITTDTLVANDLSCGSAVPALTIGAPGITLDLGGHQIAAGGEGIRNDGHDGVTIKNGKVSTDEGGVELDGVTGNVVRDIEFGGLFEGVTLRNSDGNRIVDNITVSNQIRLLDGSDRNTLARNTVTRYESSVSVTDSVENRVVDNVIWIEEGVTLSLRRAHRNRLRGNVLVTDSASVLSLTAANGNEIVDNLIVERKGLYPPGPGVALDGSNRNLLARNEISGAPLGVWLRSGNANVLRDNVARGAHFPGFGTFDQQPDGFFVAPAAQRTIVQGNTASGFAEDGFGLHGARTEVGGNTANDNGRYGIHAQPPAIDRGGNRASGNGAGTPQCVGVVCS